MLEDKNVLEMHYDYPDSEFYKVKIGKSHIPQADEGIFAAKDMAKGQTILQYYGAIIPTNLSYSMPFLREDKMVYLDENFCVISRSPASKANDIIIWEPEKYNTKEYQNLWRKNK